MESPVDSLHLIQEKINDLQYLGRIVLYSFLVHSSEKRRNRIIHQLNKKKNTNKSMEEWEAIINEIKRMPESKVMINVLELGINDENYFPEVLDLVICLIQIPIIRMYLEPLMEEILFTVRCPDHPKLEVLFYYLSFKFTILDGLLSWKQVVNIHNLLIIEFQELIFSISPKNELVYATIDKLSDFEYVDRNLSEFSEEEFSIIRDKFFISGKYRKEEVIRAIFQCIQQPINPIKHIPKFLYPIKYPPKLEMPAFTCRALSILDAEIQIFLNKRYSGTICVMDFLNNCIKELRQNKFSRHIIPLNGPPAKTLFSKDSREYFLSFVPHIYNSGYIKLDVGDIVYLTSYKAERFIPATVVRLESNTNTKIYVHGEQMPTIDDKICIKLHQNIAKEISRMINLRQIIKKNQISEELANSFIGQDTVTKPITLVEVPLGTNPAYDAAKWLSSVFREEEKTLVLATSTYVFDQFTNFFFGFKGMPQMFVLRYDLPKEIGIQVALKSRETTLEDVASFNEDNSSSCLVGYNYLEIDHPEEKELAYYLKILRPLEVIENTDKRFDYLKHRQAKIICQLFSPKTPYDDEIRYDNVIVLDTCTIEDSDLLIIMNHTKCKNIRLYGEGPAFIRMRQMNSRTTVYPYLKAENNAVERNQELTYYLSLENQIHVDAPGLVSTLLFLKCPDNRKHEVCVASYLFFRMLGYESISILVSDEESYYQIYSILRKRTSWNQALLLPNCLDFESEFIEKGEFKDVILYDGPVNEKSDVKKICSRSFLAFWSFGEDLIDTKITLALDEKFGSEIPYNRTTFEVDSYKAFLQLVSTMQNQFV